MNYLAELRRRLYDRRHPISPLSEQDWAPIAAALRQLPAPERTRDFRLDPRTVAPAGNPWRRWAPAPMLAAIVLVVMVSLSGSISNLLPSSSPGAPFFGPAMNNNLGGDTSSGTRSVSGANVLGSPTGAPAPACLPSPANASPSAAPNGSGALSSATPPALSTLPAPLASPSPTSSPSPSPSAPILSPATPGGCQP